MSRLFCERVQEESDSRSNVFQRHMARNSKNTGGHQCLSVLGEIAARVGGIYRTLHRFVAPIARPLS